MKKKQWKKPDIVERASELHFSEIESEKEEKRDILDKTNSTREVDIKAKKRTIAIVGVIVILALVIFIGINQSETMQEMIIKAHEKMQSKEEVANQVARATGVTSVDLTGLVTGDDVEHTHIYEAKYDENYHWEECWICGDVQNKEAHNFQENWLDGDSCSPDNLLIHSCACGYSYSTPNTRPHTPYNFYSYNQKYHIIMCSVCQSPLTESEDHKDADGITINCSHGGTCDVCKNTFEASHFITHRFTTDLKQDNSNCWFCGRNIIDMDNSQISLTYDEDNVYSYEAKIVINNDVNVKQIEVVMGDLTYYYRADIISKSYSVSGREITLTSTGRFHDDVEVVDTHLTTIYVTDEQGKKWILEEWVDLLPDKKAPSITSATVEGNGTVDNYTQKATITVNATENWCSTVYMALYNTDGVCLRDYVAVNSIGNGNFQGTIDVVGEYREPQDLIVKVKDYLGNETEVPVTVQYIDAKAPSLKNTEAYTSEWSKNKEITFDAQDLGVGKVQIAFNNVNDYQLANGEGDNYTRTYNFYGDVYDKVTAAIYLKDGLGNEQVVRVDIGKLDGTAPTITKAELQNKTIELESNDMHETLGEGSGVAGYRYVTSLEDNGTEITENSGTYTEENEIDISNMNKVKYVYIAPVDKVGNIGETVKVKLPTYSYTVNYYEQGTGEKIAESKVVGDKAKGEEVTETAINITGYNAVAPTTQKIEIQESGNEINFYYTKRNDLTYTVKYLEEGTNKELEEEKIVNNKTYKEEIEEEAIDIAGYKVEGENKQSIEIGVGTNEIIFYYSKRTDIEYRVEYYYDGKIDESKTERYVGTYEEVIREYEEKITERYELEKVENIPLTIGAKEEENVIKVWYVSKEAKLIVHHYIYDEEAGGETEEKVPGEEGGKVGDEEIEGYVTKTYETKASSKINENYECINTKPENYEGEMTEEDIVVTYYYKLKKAEIGGEIEKTAEASNGNILTEEDGVVTYNISYRAVIKEYKGTATITIVDKLPEEIDVEDARINLAGGIYNREDKTITWEEEVEVDTFGTGEMYDETFEKEIKIVYKDQNVVETLINTAEGRVEIYYPEGHSTNPGGERETIEEENKVEVEQKYRVAKEVEKVWEDNNDVKGKRPESVTIQLTANGSTIYNGQELEKVVLNDANNWKYTFTNLEKYSELGQEIEYSVVETETNEGDLEYYDTPIVTKTSLNETTEGTTANEKITVTNKYKLMNTEMESNIEKIGTEKITESKEEVSYRISYQARIEEYIGEAVIKIVDTLPYKLAKDEKGELVEGIELAGGTYEEGTQTITWEERIDHINTYTNGSYSVKIEKEIKVVYGELDATQRNMINEVKGTIDLYETEETNTVEDEYETKVEIPGKVEVKYIDRETGKEIRYIEQNEGEEAVEKTYGYEINGLAGEMYTTEEKTIPGYTYVENSGNTEGNMVEGTIEVIYYYERTKAGGVEVRYIDEETGEEITYIEQNEGEEVVEKTYGYRIEGRVGDRYKTEQKEIYGYEYVRVEGEEEGKLTEETINVTYIYRKIPAKVIVKYLEKDNTPNDDSDNKVLRIEEVIEGYVGDSYSTERQEIENYRGAEPEPNNKEGEMTQEDIYVTYYYEKIPSGIVTVKYVDVETNEEILYKAGDKEEQEKPEEYKTYREEKQGYVGEKYETEQKEIPYYNIVEELIPANREGKYTEEDEEVIYYYKKQIFDMSIDKNVEKIEINGKEQEVIDGKINKVEVVGSKIEETEVKITYRIKVRNEGEIEGRAKIVEEIPEDFKVNEETGEEWEETEEGKLETEVELKAGETKELKVVLNWKNGENNFGVQQNRVEIIETSNPANYEETEEKKENNSSISEVVMGVKTGDVTRSVIFIIATIGMIISLLVFVYVADKYMKEYKARNNIK